MESAEFTHTKSLILRILVSSVIHMVLLICRQYEGPQRICVILQIISYLKIMHQPQSVVFSQHCTHAAERQACVFRKQSASQGIMGQWLVLLFSLKMSTAQR